MNINVPALSKLMKWAIYVQIFIIFGLIIAMINGTSYDVQSLVDVMSDIRGSSKAAFNAKLGLTLAIIACLLDEVFMIVEIILIWNTNKINSLLDNNRQVNQKLCLSTFAMSIIFAVLGCLMDVIDSDAFIVFVILVMLAYLALGCVWGYKMLSKWDDPEELNNIPKYWLALFACQIACFIMSLLFQFEYFTDIISSATIIVLLYLARKNLEEMKYYSKL